MSVSSFWAAFLSLTSNETIHALKRTCVKTSGIAMMRPSAVAKRARPIWPAWLATSPLLERVISSMVVKVPIMLMTVPSRPTMVAILAIARISGSNALSSGRISSSMTLAIARRIAAEPNFAVSRPAT